MGEQTRVASEGEAALSPVSGASRDGRPLAFHRAPSPDLAPWIARLFVTAVGQPPGATLHCGLFNDTPFVRLIVSGDWTGETAAGPIRSRGGPLLFAAHSRRLPISVTGPFATFGFALRPGAMRSLGAPWGDPAPDCIVPIAAEGRWAEWGRIEALDERSPEAWLDWLEIALRRHVAAVGARRPDPLAEALDRAAFVDPGQTVTDFAKRHGVSTRRIERVARRDFGLTPKQVLRRARVLDMASQLLGFADAGEAEEQMLRYYDQSHLIRDFRALLGCTPRQLVRTPQPILTLGLEARQARRLEFLGKLDAAQAAPWR